MNEVPAFEDAVARFRRFVAEQGLPETLYWMFREDLWRRSPASVLVRMPPHSKSLELTRSVFEEGRAKGLVGITAVARVRGGLATTVWYPKRAEEEVQGWDTGLKLSVNQPLPLALAVPPLLWALVTCIPRYKRYQAREWFIGTREWAAEQPDAADEAHAG
jgi:hypothetical protein